MGKLISTQQKIFNAIANSDCFDTCLADQQNLRVNLAQLGIVGPASDIQIMSDGGFEIPLHLTTPDCPSKKLFESGIRTALANLPCCQGMKIRIVEGAPLDTRKNPMFQNFLVQISTGQLRPSMPGS